MATGNNVSFVWDFGDGQTGSGANPTHTYWQYRQLHRHRDRHQRHQPSVADTVVNVNLSTTGILVSQLDSEFGAVITYTYVVTHIAPPGSPAAAVTISGSIPANTSLVSVSNATAVSSGGDYGNGFVVSAPGLSVAPGASATITWIVQSKVPLGDVLNQAHASTDDGRLQIFERDRVFRSLIMITCNRCGRS